MEIDVNDRVFDDDGFFGTVKEIDDQYALVKYDEFENDSWVRLTYLHNCKENHFPFKVIPFKY